MPIVGLMWRTPPSLAVICATILVGASGCASNRDYWDEDEIRPFFRITPPAVQPPRSEKPIVQAAFQEPKQGEAFGSVLTSDDLVRRVLAQNPTLDQMRAAAEAVAARYPQVTSLDDPMFAFNTAPGSIGSPNADYAARVELSQKFLYPGKRNLKGQVATAEAAAATRDIDDTRLSLVAAAKSALADYYLAEKGASVAQENLKLLREFHQNAETRYKTGVGPQQDVLQADVELARQEERLIALRRAKQVAIARINTLMHAAPDAPLPPPEELKSTATAPDAAHARGIAIQSRPDLKAATDRLMADEAALALAKKEYNPDVEVLTAYDGFWQGEGGRPLQWQVGARVNLPVRQARRNGAVGEAQSKVAQRRAELAKLTDRINFEVQEAVEQVREAEDVVRVYEAKILPAADANVKEAQTGYVNNKVPFLNLIEAQRNRVGLRDRYFETIAETVRRRASLERAIGSPGVQQTR